MNLDEILEQYDRAEKHTDITKFAEMAFETSKSEGDWQKIINNIPAEDIMEWVQDNADNSSFDSNTKRSIFVYNIDASDAVVIETDENGRILFIDATDSSEADDLVVEFDLATEDGSFGNEDDD